MLISSGSAVNLALFQVLFNAMPLLPAVRLRRNGGLALDLTGSTTYIPWPDVVRRICSGQCHEEQKKSSCR